MLPNSKSWFFSPHPRREQKKATKLQYGIFFHYLIMGATTGQSEQLPLIFIVL
jgi:hypothetical protein